MASNMCFFPLRDSNIIEFCPSQQIGAVHLCPAIMFIKAREGSTDTFPAQATS